MAKLANSDTTIELFTAEYKVPLLPPELAANLALSSELTTPALLVRSNDEGRSPRAPWHDGRHRGIPPPVGVADHLQWAAMLLVLLCRGAAKLSLDHVVWQRLGQLGGAAASAAKESRINEI